MTRKDRDYGANIANLVLQSVENEPLPPARKELVQRGKAISALGSDEAACRLHRLPRPGSPARRVADHEHRRDGPPADVIALLNGGSVHHIILAN